MIWLCSSSSREVEKLTIALRLLSGRYRLDSIARFYTPWNRDGMCRLSLCWDSAWAHKGDIENFICHCKSLQSVRTSLLNSMMFFLSSSHPRLHLIVENFLLTEASMTQFFLDCSTLPDVISDVQTHGEDSLGLLLRLARNFCYGLHSERNKQISVQENQ